MYQLTGFLNRRSPRCGGCWSGPLRVDVPEAQSPHDLLLSHRERSSAHPHCACVVLGRSSRSRIGLRTRTHTHRGYLDTWHRIDVWPDSVQVLGETLSHSGCPPRFGVALNWLADSPGAVRGEAEN